MVRFLKIYITLFCIAFFAMWLYYYFNASLSSTNIENIVKSDSSSQENIEGTVVAKRSTENN